jgi:hypothetical protein
MKKGVAMLLITALTIQGCKVDEEFEGPSLTDLYGSFAILEDFDITDRSVNFSENETTTFTATFNKNVSWKLEIKGLSSGAVKEITGFSSQLDATNALWNGTTTVLPMFRPEECAVELTFTNEADTLRDTLNVTGGRVNTGFLLSDFETGFPSGWNTFVQSGANMTFIVQNNNSAAQGARYYDMGGTVGWDWLKGLINIPATAYGSDHFELPSNPNGLFFNVMIYKPEEINNALVLFQFKEDDNLDGTYNTANEDLFAVEVAPSVNGWSLISVNYADMVTLVNGQPAAPIGNGIREPHKLKEVSVLFLANPTSGYSQSYMDYLIFTQNGPLIP